MPPTVVHVAPHPDDEALGCPGSLLHLLDRGWQVVSVLTSPGLPDQRDRRRAEFEMASQRANFVPVFLEPPLDISLHDDLALAADRVAVELPAIVAAYDARLVVSPSPHDVHHGHEAVGRGVRQAMESVSSSVRWWMWGLWGDLPVPNVYYAFDEPALTRMLHILDAYGGELERNDFRRLLTGRASANAVLGSERVFGFGSGAASVLPYAELLTEVRRVDGRWLASQAHHLDEGPLHDELFTNDLTLWLQSPSVRRIVGPIPEVSIDSHGAQSTPGADESGSGAGCNPTNGRKIPPML